MEIIKIVSASYKEFLRLFDSILEENHDQAFISIVPEIASAWWREGLKWIQSIINMFSLFIAQKLQDIRRKISIAPTKE